MMQEWWEDAKLGIFLHWGIYAVKGVSESWSFFNGYISYDDYMAQLDGFSAAKYDPDEWAELFAQAGARYAVLTTKHHDGVALWDTQANDLSVVKKCPAGRDLVGPYVEALRRKGIKVGLYFSLLDWSNPDYASVLPEGDFDPEYAKTRPWEFTTKADDYEAWQRFLDSNNTQLRELCQQYKPDVLWFDGDWCRSRNQWKAKELRDYLHSLVPYVILNSRISGYGDFDTPEQELPVIPPAGPWELCMTVNDNWGFRHADQNFKSPYEIMRIFAECIHGGGNLLLGFGPREDGSFPDEEVAMFREIGRWTSKYGEAIYNTRRGISAQHFAGGSSLSKDRKKLYLFVYDRPLEKVVLKGLKGKVKKISDLASGDELKYSTFGGHLPSHNSATLWISFPECYHDALISVIKIELEEPLSLDLSSGAVVTQN